MLRHEDLLRPALQSGGDLARGELARADSRLQPLLVPSKHLDGRNRWVPITPKLLDAQKLVELPQFDGRLRAAPSKPLQAAHGGAHRAL